MNHLNEEGESEMNPTTIGLDIAKNVFQVPGVNGRGKARGAEEGHRAAR